MNVKEWQKHRRRAGVGPTEGAGTYPEGNKEALEDFNQVGGALSLYTLICKVGTAVLLHQVVGCI